MMEHFVIGALHLKSAAAMEHFVIGALHLRSASLEAKNDHMEPLARGAPLLLNTIVYKSDLRSGLL